MSKLATVRRLLEEGRSVKEVARSVYGDGTEVGQRRVRAIISKLKKRKAGNATSSNSKDVTSLIAINVRGRASQLGCGGMVKHRNPLINRNSPIYHNCGPQPSHLMESQLSEVVKAPVAGLGSRVGYVLERDVITAIVCDSVVAKIIQRFADRITGAGFYLYHHDGIAFQSKGDVVAISEPSGDLEKASKVLEQVLELADLSSEQIEEAVLRLKHPAQISYEELTVEISDPETIEIIRRCEPHIPDPGRGLYLILAPSPLIPGLKIYMQSASQLRIELIAHNEKQAYNAFFMRGELVGDVLPRIKRSPGIFDEWRAQYWHPYSHPMVVNLTIEAPKAAYKRNIPEGTVTFDSLPPEVKEAISNLRDRGVLWYNDYRVGMSEKLKKAFRRDPSRIMRELEGAQPTERRITMLLLQKTVVDYDLLLRYLKEG